MPILKEVLDACEDLSPGKDFSGTITLTGDVGVAGLTAGMDCNVQYENSEVQKANLATGAGGSTMLAGGTVGCLVAPGASLPSNDLGESGYVVAAGSVTYGPGPVGWRCRRRCAAGRAGG